MRGVVSGNVGKIYKAENVGQYFLLSFSVAEKVYQGRDKGTTDSWHKIELWGSRAESLVSYLKIGQHVDVLGQAYVETYTKQDGTSGSNLVVKASDVLLGPGGQEAPPVNVPAHAAPPAAPPSHPASSLPPPPKDPDDDIPF